MDFLAELVCDEDWFPAVCEDVIFLLAGFDKAQMNETLLDTIVHHSPAGTSARAIVHYAQEVNSGIHSRTNTCIYYTMSNLEYQETLEPLPNIYF